MIHVVEVTRAGPLRDLPDQWPRISMDLSAFHAVQPAAPVVPVFFAVAACDVSVTELGGTLEAVDVPLVEEFAVKDVLEHALPTQQALAERAFG